MAVTPAMIGAIAASLGQAVFLDTACGARIAASVDNQCRQVYWAWGSGKRRRKEEKEKKANEDLNELQWPCNVPSATVVPACSHHPCADCALCSCPTVWKGWRQPQRPKKVNDFFLCFAINFLERSNFVFWFPVWRNWVYGHLCNYKRVQRAEDVTPWEF